MFFNLWGRAIENKDYVRYAEVAREIVERGDWLVLRLGGEYYADKPPLHFWKIAGAYELFGVNAGAARVPSAAFAVLGVMVAYIYGARVLRSRAGGMAAALMLLSAYGCFWWGRRTRMDMEYGMLVSVALASFHLGWEAGGAQRRWWYALFWGATGAAFLDKAFFAFGTCVVVLVWVGVNALAKTPSLRARFGPGAFFATMPVVLLPIVPWALAVYAQPEFKAYWQAFLDRTIMNSREWLLFYLHALPTYLLPWSPLLLYGVWECVRLRKDPARPRELAFALTWAGTIFVLLNCTAVKDHRYLLPLYVPCQIIAAWALVRLLRRYPAACGRTVLWGDRAIAVAAGIACIAALGAAFHYRHAIAVSFLTAAALGAAFVVFRRYAPLPFVRLCVSVIVLLHAIEAIDVARNERACPRLGMAHAIRAKGVAAEEVAVYTPALAPSAAREEKERAAVVERLRTVLSFHLDRLLARGDSLAALVADPAVRAIVMDKAAGERLLAEPHAAAKGDLIALDARGDGMLLFVKKHD